MMESFIYEPLDSEQHDFRLLTLLGGDEKQIRCRISHYSLSSDSAISKPYEALSYAWGVTAFVECIEVNDKEFWITENLKTALDVLRHRDKGNDRTLWIDAICVNQEDLKECNQQVPMMGEIFEKAEQVIFWLGKATKHARTLMRCLNTLESAFVDRSEGEHWEIDDTRWLGLWNSFGFAEEVKQACVTGLEFLLSQPWFERVWIIQEVARASVGTVCISDFNVSPKILAVAPVVLDTIPDPHCLSILSIMPGVTNPRPEWLYQNNDIITIMSRFRNCKATKVHDRIYGLLAVCTHHDIQINYDQPASEVFQQVFDATLNMTTASLHEVLLIFQNLPTLSAVFMVKVQEDIWASSMKMASFEVIDGYWRTRYESLEPLFDALMSVHKETKFDWRLLIEPNEHRVSDTEKTMFQKISHLQRKEDGGPGYLLTRRLFDDGTSMAHVQVMVPEVMTAKVWAINDLGMALHTAHYYTGLSTARALLQSVKWSPDLLDPVFQASVTRLRHEIVELLLETRSTHNATQLDLDKALGRIPLGESSDRKQIALHIFEKLIQSGASSTSLQNNIGVLIAALLEPGFTGLAETLLCKDPDLAQVALFTASSSGDPDAIQVLLSYVKNVNCIDPKTGLTPLMAACTPGKENCVRKLIAGGADVNQQAISGHTALFQAVIHRAKLSMRQLISAGAGTNIMDKDGRTALFEAARCKNEKAIDKLIAAGADVNFADKLGRTPLFEATTSEHMIGMRYLMVAGADVNHKDNRGLTALFEAARHREEYCIRMLINAGADVNSTDDRGRTAMFVAVNYGSVDSQLPLLAAGADLNHKDTDGQTVFLMAMHRQNCVHSKIIAAAADVNQVDDRGNTALIIATRSLFYSKEVVESLLKAGADVHYQSAEHGTAFHALINTWSFKDCCYSDGPILTADCLLEYGAQPSEEDAETLRRWQSHLMITRRRTIAP